MEGFQEKEEKKTEKNTSNKPNMVEVPSWQATNVGSFASATNTYIHTYNKLLYSALLRMTQDIGRSNGHQPSRISSARWVMLHLYLNQVAVRFSIPVSSSCSQEYKIPVLTDLHAPC